MRMPAGCVEFYDWDARSAEAALSEFGPSRTVQSEKDDADINLIVHRFGVTGVLPVRSMPPLFGDFSEGVEDYGSALRLVQTADAAFMELDAGLRKQFDNDAGKFVAFCSDPANADKLVEMGVRVKPDPVAVEPKATAEGTGTPKA